VKIISEAAHYYIVVAVVYCCNLCNWILHEILKLLDMPCSGIPNYQHEMRLINKMILLQDISLASQTVVFLLSLGQEKHTSPIAIHAAVQAF